MLQPARIVLAGEDPQIEQPEARVEIGYRLAAEAWGQGYATEMTRALLKYGFAAASRPNNT
jgi:RimJ/RimL family protein N-acetyltransferase